MGNRGSQGGTVSVFTPSVYIFTCQNLMYVPGNTHRSHLTPRLGGRKGYPLSRKSGEDGLYE